MAALVHPLYGSSYEREDDGTVRVIERDGRSGWFRANGSHVRGPVRWADPHILDWVGGPQANTSHQRLKAASRRVVS